MNTMSRVHIDVVEYFNIHALSVVWNKHAQGVNFHLYMHDDASFVCIAIQYVRPIYFQNNFKHWMLCAGSSDSRNSLSYTTNIFGIIVVSLMVGNQK